MSPYRYTKLRAPEVPQKPRNKWIRTALVSILGFSVTTSEGDSNPRSALNRILHLPVSHPSRLDATREYMAQGIDHVRNHRDALGLDAFTTANELHPSGELEYNVVVLLVRSLGYQQPPLDPTATVYDWNNVPLVELRSDPAYSQALNNYTASLATTANTNRLTTLRLVTRPFEERSEALSKLLAAQNHLRASIARQKQLLVSMAITTSEENITRETNCESAADRDNDDLTKCREALMFLRHNEALLPIVNEAVTALAITLNQ